MHRVAAGSVTSFKYGMNDGLHSGACVSLMLQATRSQLQTEPTQRKPCPGCVSDE